MDSDPALTALFIIAGIFVGILAVPVFFVIGWLMYSILTM